MDVALKIWRFDPATGRRQLRDYQVEAPEWASLLDVLDLVKDRVDGSLSFRRSCRMMICGSCGMRMDGRSVLACRERIRPLVEAGIVPVVEPLGNLPVIKDLVVDMASFWAPYLAQGPWLEPRAEPQDGREQIVSEAQAEPTQKGALCVNCACCVSECEPWREAGGFLGPHALTAAMRFVADTRDAQAAERLARVSGADGVSGCTRCRACDERCPKSIDPLAAIDELERRLAGTY
ncbi:MAG: succinate dehydrogenase/fumarate reductase iron-sulfur subunit [Gaiellaceae bacterium]